MGERPAGLPASRLFLVSARGCSMLRLGRDAYRGPPCRLMVGATARSMGLRLRSRGSFRQSPLAVLFLKREQHTLRREHHHHPALGRLHQRACGEPGASMLAWVGAGEQCPRRVWGPLRGTSKERTPLPQQPPCSFSDTPHPRGARGLTPRSRPACSTRDLPVEGRRRLGCRNNPASPTHRSRPEPGTP